GLSRFSNMERSHTCTGSSTPRGPLTAREKRRQQCCLPSFPSASAPQTNPFRGSIAGLRAPLSTLRCALAGRQRMTRGHRDSLDLLVYEPFIRFSMPGYPGAFRKGGAPRVASETPELDGGCCTNSEDSLCGWPGV